jgi:hypothetical protein
MRPMVLFVLAASAAAGCRLSDPVYALKDIRAAEPSRAGKSLLFGTIVVEEWMAGDLDSVTLAKLGPGGERSYHGVNRVNLFRAFFPRSMKDGSFVMEIDPGLYELDSFSTSGWGKPHSWEAATDARPHTRILVTRPGVYDLGTLRVQRANGVFSGYGFERTNETTPERRAVLERAIAGTAWQRLLAAAATAEP